MTLLQARTSSPAQARTAANGVDGHALVRIVDEVASTELGSAEVLDDPFSAPLPVRVPPAGGGGWRQRPGLRPRV